MTRLKTLLVIALPLLSTLTASAHLTYTGRDFGLFSVGTPRTSVISGQTTKAFGWAEGTDADFARQDDQRYFRFTLDATATIWIAAQAVDPANMLPAFSIFEGLGHWVTDSTNPDYDGATVTSNYLASLGAPQLRDGAFDALHTWKIGNDSKPEVGYVAELVTLTYMDHAADGTAANYGTTPGIKGDGAADGFVTGSYTLPAGSYTLVVGGANYFTADGTNRGIITQVSTEGPRSPLPVPEPSSALLVAIGGMVGLCRRNRSCPMAA